MPVREWQEWLELMRTEPVGEERQDWRVARLASMFANVHRKADAEPFAARDFVFMPELAPPPPAEPTDPVSADLAAWARELGAEAAA